MINARLDARISISTITVESLPTNVQKGVGFLQRICSMNNSAPHVNALQILSEENHPVASLMKIENDFIVKKNELFAFDDIFQIYDLRTRLNLFLPCPNNRDFTTLAGNRWTLSIREVQRVRGG